MTNPNENSPEQSDPELSSNRSKPPRRHPSFCRNVIQYIYEYSENSNIHGMKYIGEKKRTFAERFFWVVVVGLSVYLCIYMIIKTYQKWDTSPVIVSFARSPKPILKIPFPSVTVCPETKTRKSIYDFTEKYLDVRDKKPLNDEEIDKFGKISLICNNHPYHNGSEYIGYDTVDFLAQVAPTFDQVLWMCKWLNLNITCDQLFTKMLTEEGVCYSFNLLDRDELFTNEVFHNADYLSHGIKADNWSLENGYSEELGKDTFPRRAIAAGVKGAMFMVLTAFDYDMDYICRGPIQGFKISLHNPVEYPLISQQYFRVPLNQEMIVAVKPEMMTTSDGLRDYDPHARQCYFPSERQLRFFKVYTQRNCEIECLTNYTLNKCGCVGFHMPHTENTKLCGPGKAECMRDAQASLLVKQVEYGLKKSDKDGMEGHSENCDCLPACTSLIYNADTSQADFDWTKVFEAYKADFSEFPGIEMTRVIIFFKEQQFINSERNELYGPTDFFASCGGLLGLFMGFSVLSVVEIAYFLTLRIVCNVYKYGHYFWSGSAALVNNDSYELKRRRQTVK